MNTKACGLTFWAAALLTATAAAPLQTKEKGPDVPPEILPPPAGVQTKFPFYKPTQYLHIKEYNIHVFGTETVTPWMMRESCELIRQVVACLKNPTDREKFSGHQAFLITNADPDLSLARGRKGQRGTGGKGFSVFNEALVCTTAVSTLYPDQPPQYRGWNVPVHELGHSVENTLDLKDRSDDVFKKNVPNYNPEKRREYFAWATEEWFGCARRGRGAMSKWKYEYLATIFSEENKWIPNCNPRP